MKKKELKQEIERLKSVIQSSREKELNDREKAITDKIMIITEIIKSIDSNPQLIIDYERDSFNNLVYTHYTFKLTV